MTEQTTPTFATIQDAAATMRGFFHTFKRNENDRILWRTQDDTPEWVTELCHTAHGDMLPDDWRYEFIVDALDAITETDRDDTEADQADEHLNEYVYTSGLTAWLGSRADRYGYCDEAMAERGTEFTGTIELLQIGIYAEQSEVLYAVKSALADYVTGDSD